MHEKRVTAMRQISLPVLPFQQRYVEYKPRL